MAQSGSGGWPAGVEPLDHTADVGLRASAESLAELFVRAARGLRLLIEGEAEAASVGGVETHRTIEIEAGDLSALLVAWLRELLYLHQVEGLAFRSAGFDRVGEFTLCARVSFGAAVAEPDREIKGVTYHGLRAERDGTRWRAQVIFDV